jgi:hypothetical protein
MTERWLPVDGHPGYEVSDLGRVRSIDRQITQTNRWGTEMTYFRKGALRKPQRSSNGYLFVALAYGHMALIHRLVAAAFVDGNTSLTVNHDDGDVTNNRWTNLQWMTCGANIKHSYDHLVRKQHSKTCPVIHGGVYHPSTIAAAKAAGVSVGSIYSALKKGHKCRGKEVVHG